MTARNFVLLFREREGSSAIINLLNQHPRLKVPVFEQLDEYSSPGVCEHATIARLAGLTYQTGDFEQARQLLAGNGVPRALPESGVGFKWRIWGPAGPVVRMLQDQQVVVLHLFRLRLLELATSVIFSTVVIPALERSGAEFGGAGHLQFKMADMTSEQRIALQRRLSGIRFRADPAQVGEIAREVLAFKRRVHQTYLRPLQDAGIAVRSMVYEDFVADRHGFMQAVCGAIGVDPAPLRAAESYYRKVHLQPLSSQIDNWADVSRDLALREIMAEYRKLISSDHTYLPAAPCP